MSFKYPLVLTSLSLILSSPVLAVTVTPPSEEEASPHSVAHPALGLLDPHILEQLEELRARNRQLEDQLAQVKDWKVVPVCDETVANNFLGGQYYETNETNTWGHKKVIGRNDAVAYWDPEAARDGAPRGVYTLEGSNVRFYIRGNCNLFPNEGPGALNDKWIGGPLHASGKYQNLSNASSAQHAQNTFRRLFG